MKALSGFAEYFWLLAMNIKPVENRKWSLTRQIKRDDLPVTVYLHCSKTPVSAEDKAFILSKLTPEQRRQFEWVNWDSLRGCIIGEVTITDEVTNEDIGHPATRSRWFFGPYGFVVKDGKLYDRPVKCRGQLGFFEVNLEALKT